MSGYKANSSTNSAAYRRFHSPGMGHKLTWALMVLMGAAGVLACLIAFWPA